MAEQVNLREIVYDMLIHVTKQNAPSHEVLSQALTKYQYLDKKERSFISRLFKGVLEQQIFLDNVIQQFSSVKLNKMKVPVKCMLRMGIYQILKMDAIPDSAACNEMVKLAKKRGLKNLSGFINGVLRQVSRNKDNIQLPDAQYHPVQYLSVKYALPEWIVQQWIKKYSFTEIEKIGQALLDEQETSVRIRRKEDADSIIQELKQAGVSVKPGQIIDLALKISGYDYLGMIPAFTDGRMTVQDESAMLAAIASTPSEGNRIIDVCAAPGGKSMHMADLIHDKGSISSRDLTQYKIDKIIENIERTHHSCIIPELADALVLREDDIETADIIMADLPCSGLGVMGRKPDIKHAMSEKKINELASLQRDILNVVWQYVKPGGVLIYSTCTVSEAENEQNMKWFEEHYPFKLESLDPFLPEKLHNAETKEGYIQILPGQYGSDGFFIARFRRIH